MPQIVARQNTSPLFKNVLKHMMTTSTHVSEALAMVFIVYFDLISGVNSGIIGLVSLGFVSNDIL